MPLPYSTNLKDPLLHTQRYLSSTRSINTRPNKPPRKAYRSPLPFSPPPPSLSLSARASFRIYNWPTRVGAAWTDVRICTSLLSSPLLSSPTAAPHSTRHSPSSPPYLAEREQREKRILACPAITSRVSDASCHPSHISPPSPSSSAPRFHRAGP